VAAQTFRGVWSRVLLHAPAVPASLAQSWTQDAYDKLIARRHWAWTRRQTFLQVLAARAVTTTFTQNSTAITSAAAFVASDAGRQIRVANGAIYTIDVVTNASNAILETPYSVATTAPEAATISDIYLPMPADFRSFHDVTDLSNQRPVVWWIAKDRLDLYDPGRVSADSRFRVLAAHEISQGTPNLGRLLYEAWPHPTAAGSYVVNYFIRTDSLGDDTPFQGVLATYAKALETGALAEAAKWPGTAQQRNPYFNLALATKLEEEFDSACNDLDVMDDDQYLMSLQQIDLAQYGLAAVAASANLLRATDATGADYYGGF
jgi:hypothetical protein